MSRTFRSEVGIKLRESWQWPSVTPIQNTILHTSIHCGYNTAPYGGHRWAVTMEFAVQIVSQIYSSAL